MEREHDEPGQGGDVVTALRLMRLALPLLDRADCDLAATRLQHAIDGLDEIREPRRVVAP